MLMDYTSIVIPKAFQEEVLKREHLSHTRTFCQVLLARLQDDMKQMVGKSALHCAILGVQAAQYIVLQLLSIHHS